ncbi:NADH oxidase (plasmid) [Azospirillum sp. B510]|uniref:NADH:flavin oxidoreductase n=1 Tax=Azospirillum sp. (strain B510) TaxID=137722 RepID=UPI0001C4CB17|nr:NADH:flavin oxidoreductase [Azospirillum sp. B510]BAI74806.1 NADH oxidase [Azospirillum sp. B510]
MTHDIEGLFQPLTLRGATLRNRIVMSPMARGFSPDGVPGANVAGYYRRRAAGGTGLIITEGVGIDHPSALGEAGLGENATPELHGEAALEGWRQVVAGVHAEGGIIFPQLWHMGVMKELGTGPYPEAPPMRPSGLWGPLGRKTSIDADYIGRASAPTQPMSENEIADTIAAYARSAANAKAVGFDGIAIHGGHGYLIDSFLWAETNLRTDRWGGDRRGRARFAVEVVKAVRSAIGEELPISFRFSQWKQQDFSARLAETPDELGEILQPLAEAGVDLFEASTRYFAQPAFPESGSPLNLAGWAKALTGKLAMTVGGVGIDKGFYDTMAGAAASVARLDLLMERFNRGEFDLVGVGRMLLHEPEWVNKVRAGAAITAFSTDSLKVLT